MQAVTETGHVGARQDGAAKGAPTQLSVWEWGRTDPERVALIDPTGRSIRFGELAAASNRVANGLRAMGLRAGDGVAVITPNVSEFYEIFLAAMQIGLYFTPVNSYLAAPEIAYVLSDCGAKAFFVHKNVGDIAARAIESAGYDPQRCFSLGGDDKFRAYEQFKAEHSPAAPEERTAGQPMVYTSGTTGHPKGVRRALHGCAPDERLATHIDLGANCGWTPGQGVYLLNGPLHHSAPIAFSVPSLHLGHTVVMTEKWDSENVLALIEKYRVNNSQMVPIHFIRLLKLPAEVRAKYDVSSVRCLVHSAAPCPVPVKREMIEWFGPVLIELYGGTEGSGTIINSHEWLRKPGSVGRAAPGVEVKILDDDGAVLPPGQVGTVYLKPQGSLPQYHNDAAKTAASQRDGHFTLGDMGYLDDDGYLFLVDRKIDMVVSGGVNIYPAEIEAVLLQHPEVEDVAVFGIPNEEWGEELKAVVQLRAGAAGGDDLTADLRRFSAERLAKFKIPKTFDFVAALPRAPNGKLYKRQLRDPYWAGRTAGI